MSKSYFMKLVSTFITLLFINYWISAQAKQSYLEIDLDTFTSQSGQKVLGEVGSLKVLENRAKEDSRWISVEFVRLKQISKSSLGDDSANMNKAPLIYLEGGPGSACTWQTRNAYFLENWLPFLEDRDVILFDQRCSSQDARESLLIWKEAMPENALVDLQTMNGLYQQVIPEVLKMCNEKGIDLSGYTTRANAQDIEDLRKALNIDKLSLLGFSYGTHLGQAYIRYFGRHVENAILIGTEGSNHNYKLPSTMDTQFRKLNLMVQADPNVSKDVPDLISLYQRVLKKLEIEPAEIEVISRITRKPMKLRIGVVGLQGIIRFDIGDASDLPVFPRLLYSIDQGDYSLLTWFAQKRFGAFGINGITTTMDLASGVSPERKDRINAEQKESLFPHIVNFTLDVAEPFWPIPDLGQEYRTPLISSVRTLFMSGTLDFNTPPFQAEEVRWGFSNSSHIIVDNAGHEQVLTHPKATETIRKFLKGENVDDVALFHPPLKFIPVTGDGGDLYHPSMGER